MSERKKITMAQARAHALEDVAKDIKRYCYAGVCGNSDQCQYHEAFNQGVDEAVSRLERHQAEANAALLFLHAAVVKIWSYIADAQEGMNPFPPMAKLTTEAVFDLVSKAEQLCCDTAGSKEYAAAIQRAREGNNAS